MKLVSYNIQFGTGKDGRVSIPRIAEEIAGADIIALQEVERFWSRSGYQDQVQLLADLHPEHYWVYGPALDLAPPGNDKSPGYRGRRRQFGNMVLSRFPILAARNHVLPKMDLGTDLSLQRAAQEAVIDVPEGPIRFVSFHLGHKSGAERAAQIATLRSILARAPQESGAWTGRVFRDDWDRDGLAPPQPQAALLMGDCNMTPADPEYGLMTGQAPESAEPAFRLRDAWASLNLGEDEGMTCLEEDGNKRLDYAFLTTDLVARLKSAQVDQAAQGSDHQPLWIELA
jgi:endonuclease/exonuclease/phosphatase family metal-dependent hydrolase